MARGKKDPNKPKGRTTAYAYFIQSEREAIRTRNKEDGQDVTPSFIELSKFCSEKWKCLDDTKKAPFFTLATVDKTRYDQEMANYTPPSEDEAEETPKKSRKRKRQKDDAENRPKRNKSAYLFFCDEERPKVRESQPGLAMTEVAKVLGGFWSSLDEIRKEKFTKLAAEDKARYSKQMQEYQQKPSEDDVSSVKKQREVLK